MAFALSCIFFTRLLVTLPPPDETSAGISSPTLYVFMITFPPLTLVFLIAAILIAPKHLPSPERGPPSSTAMLGIKLYLGGLGIQFIMLLAALILATLLHKKTIENRPPPSLQMERAETGGEQGKKLRKVSYALLFSLLAIDTRTVYRLVELSAFFTGFAKDLAHHEVYFYALECAPVLAAVGVWTVVDTQCLFLEGSDVTRTRPEYVYQEVSGEEREEGDVLLTKVGRDES